MINQTEQSKRSVDGLPAANERGATMIEYALMVALLGVACIGAVTALRINIDTAYDRAEDALAGAIVPAAPTF